MLRLNASAISLLISVMLGWAANGLCFTLLALGMNIEGLDTTDIGFVTSGYFFGFVFELYMGCVKLGC